MHYSRAYVDRDSKSDDGMIRFVAATEGEKGDGISLMMDGAMLERYRSNPVFGYGHRYFSREDLPIGRASEVKLVGRTLKIGVEFDQSDEFATKVERKYRDGFLNAVSIGFEVTKWENDAGSYWRGGVAEEWELLEVSAVPVPMDASAVVESGRSLDMLGGLPLDPSVTVERDSCTLTRSIRVSEQTIRNADPMELGAYIARHLRDAPVRDVAPVVPSVQPPPSVQLDDAALSAAIRAELVRWARTLPTPAADLDVIDEAGEEPTLPAPGTDPAPEAPAPVEGVDENAARSLLAAITIAETEAAQ